MAKVVFNQRFLLYAVWVCTFVSVSSAIVVHADDAALLKQHCAKCHNDESAEGDFKLSVLGEQPSEKNFQHWLESLDRVTAGEMPPEDESQLLASDRKKLIGFLKDKIRGFKADSKSSSKPRRLNNREFENAIRDVLMIEDVGTHLPTDDLIGDALYHGFDTHADTLGFSKFHLEQYIVAVRKIVDATILSGDRPVSRSYSFGSTDIYSKTTSQNTTRPDRAGNKVGFDFRDPRQLAYCSGFATAPKTGYYKIKIRCAGKDRKLYAAKDTGVYHGDPIRLNVLLGGREKSFELPDEEETLLELNEWVAEGSQLRMRYPTDGLRLQGNGNFKFQNRIAGAFVKKNDPALYAKVKESLRPKSSGRRSRAIDSWHHWVEYWRGPRPRIYDVEIEGPFFESWPPKRHVALIGENAKAENALQVLKPIARRAWRRPVRPGELDPIVELVKRKANELGDIEALKEGVVSILVSPQFLLLNREDNSSEVRFATKLNTFMRGTIPDAQSQEWLSKGHLDSFEGVRVAVKYWFDHSQSDSFLREFPYAWLELNDINFMAPDPDYYRHYHRKLVSEDMIGEALQFFRHAVDNNIPIPEFLSADYSFVNADLAQVYGLNDVPQDSRFRKYVFKDGRRGGLLGMGAFLTSTADSLSTSPIHRAVYVMENFMGIHPTPPPADVEITEPDVREAKTIKEILKKHQTDSNCASCHQTIDPFGYAFENFDPSGAWRDEYSVVAVAKKRNRKSKTPSIPIDASSKFRNGTEYRDIVGYRKQLLTEANRDRFVRCFIMKLLTYANGVEPSKTDFVEVEKILAKSAENEYRIVDTIAAVIDSPLFRGK